MARRPFDSSFSRRPGIMGDPSSFGGGRGYDEDDYGGGGRIQHSEEELYILQEAQQVYNRIPQREAGGGRMKIKEEYDDDSPSSVPGGGWRHRSPSPAQRYNPRDMEREREPRERPDMRATTWVTRPRNESSYDEVDRQQRGQAQSFIQDNFRPQQQLQQQIFSQPSGILRNPEQNVVMVQMPQGQGAGGLMGLNANPFGVGMLGQAPMVIPTFNPSPFAQQLLQSNPFGVNLSSSSGGGSSIYGAQTQQPFNRSRNLINASDNSSRGNRRGGGGGGDRGGFGGRRSDAGGRSADSSRNSDSSRKRNLVLRDPRPEEAKRPRTSDGNGIKKERNSTTKVKRISLGGGGDEKKNRNSYQKKAEVVKQEKKEESTTTNKDTKVKDEKKKDKDVNRKTDFDELPGTILSCKVCQKMMNDGQSFDSHLTGKAHQSLMRILEERFAKRVELLMTESKCSEDEIGIELERQRRAGVNKSGRADRNASNYCKMCDCHYAVNWGTHKVSLGHRMLKEFLHPRCQFCNKDFMHRRDWVTHLLSAGHLKKIVELKKEDPEFCLEEHESTNQDELFTIHVDLNREERPINAITIKARDGREPLTEEMKEILKNDRGEIMLPSGEICLPKEYNPELMVGGDAVVGVSGNRCRICRVYIPEEKSVETHCSSREHYNQYVSFLKRVNRHREHKEREKKEADEKVKKEEERAKRRADEKEAKTKKDEEDSKVKAEEKEKNGLEKMEVDGEEKVGDVKEEEKEVVEKVIELVDIDEDVDDDEEEEEVLIDEDEVLEEDEGGDDDVILEEDQNDVQEVLEEDIDGAIAEFEAEGVEESEIQEAEAPEIEEDDEKCPPAPIIDDEEIPLAPIIDDEVVELDKDEEEEEEEEEKTLEEELNDVVDTEEVVEEPITEESAEVVAIDEEEVPVTPAPPTCRRGRRGTPATRGRITPALRNVTAKVDSNLRGGRGARGAVRGKRRGSR